MDMPLWTNQDKPVCSECDTGKWHGRFHKRYTTDAVYYQDADGFIYIEDEVDFDFDDDCLKYNNKIKITDRA